MENRFCAVFRRDVFEDIGNFGGCGLDSKSWVFWIFHEVGKHPDLIRQGRHWSTPQVHD